MTFYRKHLLFKAVFLLLVMLFPNPFVSAQQKDSLKVLSYNILNGFYKFPGFDQGKDADRKEATGNFIRAQKPDVVALQELVGFNEKQLAAFAKNWGHDYAVIVKEGGYPVGLTSNQPIKVVAKLDDSNFGHGLLHVLSHNIHFFVLHLNPGSYKNRQEESMRIRAYMDLALKKSDSLYMVMGDFNAHSPFDAFLDEQRPKLLAMRRQQDSSKPENAGNLMYHNYAYGVIASFLGHPLVDICEQKMKPEDRYSFPTSILIGNYRKADEIFPYRERLDYILTSPQMAVTCTDATIIHTDEVEKLSDHYPVIATFKFK